MNSYIFNITNMNTIIEQLFCYRLNWYYSSEMFKGQMTKKRTYVRQ